MGRGRPPKGEKVVGKLEGSAHAKRRLETILATIAGRKTVAEACAELALSESGFRKLRDAALQAAVSGLEPKVPGRKPKATPEENAELAKLRSELTDLKIDYQASLVREEIALTMPFLLKRRRGEKGGVPVRGAGEAGGRGPEAPARPAQDVEAREADEGGLGGEDAPAPGSPQEG